MRPIGALGRGGPRARKGGIPTRSRQQRQVAAAVSPRVPAKVVQGFLLDVPNTPGALHYVTARLAHEKVNIQGIAGVAHDGRATIGLVTDNDLHTRDVLRDVGDNVRPVPFLAVTARDEPGELDRYLTKLGMAGLNIVCLFPLVSKEPTLAFAVDDPVKARAALKDI